MTDRTDGDGTGSVNQQFAHARLSMRAAAAPVDTRLAAVAALLLRYTQEPTHRLGLRSDAGPRVFEVTLGPDLAFRDAVAQTAAAAGAAAQTTAAAGAAVRSGPVPTGDPAAPDGGPPPVWLDEKPAGDSDGPVLAYDLAVLPADAGDLADQLDLLLAAGTGDPARPVGELALLPAEQRRRVLHDYNATVVDDGDQRLVPARVVDWADRQPDSPAVVCGATTVTYRELVEQARRIAAQLTAIGVGTDTLVGLWLERSPELVAATLGVSLAGAAYLGLDVDEPAVRLAATIEDAGCPVVITRAERAGQLPPGRAKVLAVEDLLSAPRRPGTDRPVGAADLCYVTYTSGSTGTPKGVLLAHRGVANLVGWYARTFHIGPGDRLLQIARPSFDGWGLEVWPALANGATLEVLPGRLPDSAADFAGWLRARGITVCFLTTALAAELLFDQVWDPATTKLRAMLVGGEKLHRYPRADLPFRVYNVYGPTETTMLATCGEMRTDAPRGQAPPIGRPLDNVRAYVLDERDQPVPVGALGELHIGGVGVARGYLGRTELTAQRFRPDPFVDDPAARRYATGDLVRWRPDGQLDFAGRADGQVKLRGFRIELGEIEAVLRAHPQVRDAVVIVHRGAGGGPADSAGSRLVGYVVPAGAADLAEVRRHVADRLPQFMVPQVFLPLDAVPLTPHGKVDRRSLADRPLPEPPVTGGGAPVGEIERILAELWCEVLELTQVGRDDSFFDLGGDSLQAMRVSARARDRGIRLVAEDLFENEVLSDLAEVLAQSMKEVRQ